MPRTRTAAVVANPATNVETVVAILPGISVRAGDIIDLEAYADITTGVATTILGLTLRRGATTAGAIVGSQVAQNITAGNRYVIGFNASDQFANDVAGQQYCLTATQTAATANGATNNCGIWVIWGV